MRQEMREQPQEVVSEPSAAAARGVPPRPPPHPTAQDALFAPPPRDPPAVPSAEAFGAPPPVVTQYRPPPRPTAAATGPAGLHPDAFPTDAGVGVHAAAASPGD